MMCHECDDTAVARGLCDTCYHRAKRLGTLGDYPRERREYTAEMCAEIVRLRRHGWAVARIAEVNGWPLNSLRRVCRREGVGGRMA
jgi:hypothetical protein